jgi:hypothetical protein
MGRRGLAALVVGAAALNGCGTGIPDASGDGAPVPIRIENATTVPVGLYLNGDWVGTYPAGAATTVSIGRPVAPPWTVELRSPSDAVLLRLNADDVALQAARDGRYGVAGSLGLPCGELTALVGTLSEGDALAPSRASVAPGPCP